MIGFLIILKFLNISAILENKNHLFVELTGRLVAYYDISHCIRNVINQCDRMSLKYNPIVPVRQIHKAPSNF